eukprot:4758925-Prymnesium_polylepis.1
MTPPCTRAIGVPNLTGRGIAIGLMDDQLDLNDERDVFAERYAAFGLQTKKLFAVKVRCPRKWPPRSHACAPAATPESTGLPSYQRLIRKSSAKHVQSADL